MNYPSNYERQGGRPRLRVFPKKHKLACKRCRRSAVILWPAIFDPPKTGTRCAHCHGVVQWETI